MNTHELKHKARVAEWKEKVSACRCSGQGVKAWCKERGISSTTYYHWEKEVLAEAERQLAIAEGSRGTNFVAVGAQPERSRREEGHPAVAGKVRKGGVEVEIYVGAEAGTIEMLLRVLKDAE